MICTHGICEGLKLSKSRLVLTMFIILMLLPMVFFTFGNSPRLTPNENHVTSASTTVVSPTERNAVPETLLSNPETTVSNPLTTAGATHSPSAGLGFCLLQPAFGISPSQVEVTSSEWTVPTSSSDPISVAVDSSGNVYFTEHLGTRLVVLCRLLTRLLSGQFQPAPASP